MASGAHSTRAAFDAVLMNDVAAMVQAFEGADPMELTQADCPTDDALEDEGEADPFIERGYTLLHHAAASGSADCIRWLIERHAKPNATTANSKTTPLHIAALHGHTQCLEALLDGHANALARDNDGHTALCLTRLFRHESATEVLRQHCIESLYLGPPSIPTYLPCSSWSSLCCVNPSLKLVVGARSTSRSFQICTPCQVSPLFGSIPRCEPNSQDEDELPLIWMKIRIKRLVCNILEDGGEEAVDVKMTPEAPRLLLVRLSDFPVTVKDLKPDSTYHVSFSAINGIGVSAYVDNSENNEETSPNSRSFAVARTLPLLASFVRRIVRKLQAALNQKLSAVRISTVKTSRGVICKRDESPHLWPNLAKATQVPPLLIERVTRHLRRSLDDCSSLSPEIKDDAVDFFLPFFMDSLTVRGCGVSAQRNLLVEIAGQLAALSAAAVRAESTSTPSISDVSFSDGTPEGVMTADAAVAWATSTVFGFFQLACRSNLSLALLSSTAGVSQKQYSTNKHLVHETLGLFKETARFAHSTRRLSKQPKKNKVKALLTKLELATSQAANGGLKSSMIYCTETHDDGMSKALDELAAEVGKNLYSGELHDEASSKAPQIQNPVELKSALHELEAEMTEATQQLEMESNLS